MSVIALSRLIGPIFIDCFISEKHTSDIEITSIPIETGANINDHAYIMPKKLSLDIAARSAAITFNALVRLQETRIPFSIITGLTIYNDMLIKSINVDRDKEYSQVLRGTVDLEQVLIVNTAVASIDVSQVGETPRGKAGGANSTRAATPTRNTSTDAVTADRATGTLQRGDSTTRSVPESQNRSIASELFG